MRKCKTNDWQQQHDAKWGRRKSQVCLCLVLDTLTRCCADRKIQTKPNHEVYILLNILNERLNVHFFFFFFYKYPNCKNGIDVSVAEMHRSATHCHPLITEHPFSMFSVCRLLLVLRISLCEIRSSSVCGLYFSTLPRREETFGP